MPEATVIAEPTTEAVETTESASDNQREETTATELPKTGSGVAADTTVSIALAAAAGVLATSGAVLRRRK